MYNKVVENINYEGNLTSPVVLSCTDGSVYGADHVIVTVSLGVLKHDYKTLFTPSLDTNKEEAILGLSFGILDKIILEFDKPFWPCEWPGFAMIWKKEDMEEVKLTNMSWFVIFYITVLLYLKFLFKLGSKI